MRVIPNLGARPRSRTTHMPLDEPYSIAYVILLCGILMFAVVTFGASGIKSSAVLEIGTATIFISLFLERIFIPTSAALRWNPLYSPMMAFAAVILFQLIFNVTSYRYASLNISLQYGADAMLVFVVSQLVYNERSCKILLLGLSIFGSLVAIFAICQTFSSALRVSWLHPPGTEGLVFGTYLNHDHYAGLMEMLAPTAVVLSTSRFVQGGQRILLAFAGIIMIGSLVLSGSRGGILSLFAEFVLLCFIFFKIQRKSFGRTKLVAVTLALLAFLIFIGSPTMWQHLGQLHDVFRFDILKDALRMYSRKPVIGWGLGTFSEVYPTFRSFYTVFYVNAAHNDYIQLLVETGAVGFSCAVWFIFTIYRNALKHIRHADRTWFGVLQQASILGSTGILVHSFLDFNLQVPANAALFYIFCAVATSWPFRNSHVLSEQCSDKIKT